MTGIRDTNDGKILENTGDLYAEIATAYPSDNYTQFCNQLGVKYAESRAILSRNLKDYKQSFIDVLNTWEAAPEEGATRAKLESAMKKAKTGALCRIVAEHFAKDAVHAEDASNEDAVHEEEESGEDAVHEEEVSGEDAVNEEEESGEDAVHEEEVSGEDAAHEEESDEDAVHEEEVSGEDAAHEEEESDEDAVHEEEESDEDAVHEKDESDEDAVHEKEESDEDDEKSDEDEQESDEEKTTQPSQRGSTLTINASGHAKVKGASMNGPINNINNYAAGASPSQGQGRKRKATGSMAGPSGEKKRKTKKGR